MSSLGLNEDVIVVGRHSPVLVVVVLVRIVLLVVSEEGVELEALLKVLGGLEAADVLEHVEVAVSVGACLDETVPVDTLELEVSVVVLEAEVHRGVETDVWALDGVHVLTRHLKLVEVEVLREHLHLLCLSIYLLINYNIRVL